MDALKRAARERGISKAKHIGNFNASERDGEGYEIREIRRT